MNAILGRYVNHDTFIHRMDPRNKFFCLIALMVAVFISYPTYEMTFIVGGAVAILIISLLLIATVAPASAARALVPCLERSLLYSMVAIDWSEYLAIEILCGLPYRSAKLALP